MEKIIILGLDGVNWKVLNELSSEGYTPNLDKIKREGTAGKMKSVIPPVTAPAWVSFATGQNPGKHGCFNFTYPNKKLSDLKTVKSTDIKSETIYERLEKEGLDSIWINLPVSYPPKTSAKMICSILSLNDDYIHPPSLKKKIPDLKNYRIVPEMSLYKKNKIKFLNDLQSVVENRFVCAKRLFMEEEWDLFFLLFSATDWLNHKYYGELISGGKSEEIVFSKKIYKIIDDYIGWFRKNKPSDASLIIVSDHGFRAYRKIFHVNEWLKRNGYLTTKKSENGTPHHRAMKEKMKHDKFTIPINRNILDNFRNTFINKIWKFLQAKRLLPFVSITPQNMPDLKNSFAVCTTSEARGIHINKLSSLSDEKDNKRNPEKMRMKIINNLKKQFGESEESRIIEKVEKKEEVYSGNQLEMAPDIIIIPKDDCYIDNNLHADIIENREIYWHDMEGIFLAEGDNIKKRTFLEQDVNLIDIAPTVLHMIGMSPEKMDGKILKNIFKKDKQ